MDQALLKVERARRALDAGAADVLVLAESSCLAHAYADQDRRLIPELIAQHAGVSVVPVAGPGYDARMFDRVLAALAGLRSRPKAVVVAINVRTNTATGVIEHPVHGHPRSLVALERLGPATGPIRAVGRGGTRSGRREIERFRALPITTRWGGPSTTGAFLAALEGQGPPPWPVALERRRFDYFHGETVGADHRALGALAALGDRLAAYGVPVVGYWAQPPVVRGEELFPGEFTAHVHANLDRVEGALDLPGHGFAPLLRPLLAAPDFQDARNGTEHYATSGRVAVAADIAAALGEILR